MAAYIWLKQMNLSLEEDYHSLLKDKQLQQDSNQLELVKIFQVYKEFLESNNQTLLRKIFSSLNVKQEPTKKGVYIHGDVGRGKSMLMDLFYTHLNIKKKQRIHFHEFMLNFHSTLHKYRESTQNTASADDQVIIIAKQIASNNKVLCLDELQINNIADAMIVGRLFKAIIERGTFVVMTSNRPPQDLFKDGLQRERFLPFIDLIQNEFLTFHLDNSKDYRLEKVTSLKETYFWPLNHDTKVDISKIINELTGGKKLEPKELIIENNRIIKAERVYGKVAIFTFSELCEQPLGAIDYLKIAKAFNTIIIENIPKLNSNNHNEALRFITLIDCLYENHTFIICSAESPINELYIGNKNSFEFDRTISRIKEMRSKEYLSNISN